MSTNLLSGRPALDRNAMNREALAEAAGDAALVAVLRGKPADDEVPSAVWWLVAEALRTAVAARRVATLPRPRCHPDDEQPMLLMEAVLLTHAALDELADATGARPVPTLVDPDPGTSPAQALQRSILVLARLLVTQRATPAALLVAALSDHHRALAAFRNTPTPLTATFAT